MSMPNLRQIYIYISFIVREIFGQWTDCVSFRNEKSLRSDHDSRSRKIIV